MLIRNLRASGSSLQAEVTVGVDDKGSNVTLNLRLDRHRNEELATAMAPLESLLSREAESRIQQAVNNNATRRSA